MACAFENFRKETMNSFELDSVHYLSTLGYSWDAMLRFSDFKVDFNYHNEFYDLHYGYRLAGGKIEVKKELLFNYQL